MKKFSLAHGDLYGHTRPPLLALVSHFVVNMQKKNNFISEERPSLTGRATQKEFQS